MTWFNLIPILVLSVLLPIIAGAVPNFTNRDGVIFCGGVVRENVINFFALNIFPIEWNNKLVHLFSVATNSMEEFLVYLPFGLNIGLLCCWFLFFILGRYMEISNKLSSIKRSAEEDAHKL
jgi:hypothetical protein